MLNLFFYSLFHKSGWVLIEDRLSFHILLSRSRLTLMFPCGGTSGTLIPQFSVLLLISCPAEFERRTWAVWSVNVSLYQLDIFWSGSPPHKQDWPCGGTLELVQHFQDRIDDKPTFFRGIISSHLVIFFNTVFISNKVIFLHQYCFDVFFSVGFDSDRL